MDLETGSPIERISALETRVIALSQVVFGDPHTRTESLFVRIDRLQASTDQINRRQIWMLAALLFVVGLISMMILQMIWAAMR